MKDMSTLVPPQHIIRPALRYETSATVVEQPYKQQQPDTAPATHADMLAPEHRHPEHTLDRHGFHPRHPSPRHQPRHIVAFAPAKLRTPSGIETYTDSTAASDTKEPPDFCSYMLKLSGTERPVALESLKNAVDEWHVLSSDNRNKHCNHEEEEEEKTPEYAKKRVRFAKPLVTKMAFRPRTTQEDMAELYFQDEELQDWELDRETTSPEQFELFITKHSRHRLHVSVAPVIARRRSTNDY